MWTQIRDALYQSVSRVLTTLAAFLPSLLAMVLAVLLAALFGAIVRWALTRVLKRIRFDERMEQWGFSLLGEWSPAGSPALLIGRLVFWSILHQGLLIGVAAVDAALMTTMMGRLLDYLPNVFVAVILVLTGGVVARFLARGVLISAVNLHLPSARLMSLGVKWLVVLFAVAMALNHLKIGGAILQLAFGILFGGIVLAMALAVGLGSKELVSRSWERQSDKRPDFAVTPQDHV
jgi:hypothetical protein